MGPLTLFLWVGAQMALIRLWLLHPKHKYWNSVFSSSAIIYSTSSQAGRLTCQSQNNSSQPMPCLFSPIIA